jgi:hypothetical protein
MRRRLAPLFLLLAVLALALPVAGCGGEDEELDVKEGEPVKADHVSYNVVISRFLNPDDTEDESYLVGQPEPPPGQEYFGVFIQLKNDGDEDIIVPEAFRVVDTLDNSFDPLDSESPYALPLGETLEPNSEMPEANSIAQDGPTQGSLVLFLVEKSSAENRPLVLEIPLPSGKVGTIELDI